MSKARTSRPWRAQVVATGFLVAAIVLVVRAVDIQVFNNERFQVKGNAAHLKTVTIPAHRGIITDRNGEPLAISTPVDSLWVNPQVVLDASLTREQLLPLSRALTVSPATLLDRLNQRRDLQFAYLQRHASQDVVNRVTSLNVPGISTVREFHRFYPLGEITAHVVGITDVDDVGREGIELQYDKWLQGKPGSKIVLQDGNSVTTAEVRQLAPARQGKDLALSIDKRIQYLAYRELKQAMQQHAAKAGTFVMLDVATGEIIALVNQPSFNPNAARTRVDERYRNRAVTDVFEPGSTIKPFIAAAALETGRFTPRTVIDTTPGVFRVGRNSVHDVRNYGAIDIATILQKSSNVGISKLALALDRDYLWQHLVRYGFGSPSGATLPGEQSGTLTDFQRWGNFDQAALSYGYGLSVTAVQLARAYSVIADDGVLKPVSIQRLDAAPQGQQVMDPTIARQVRAMLEAVVSDNGTAPAARVPGYRVAGKTGTVRQVERGSGKAAARDERSAYSTDHYVSLFAGMLPASRPRLVGVVLLNDPSKGVYYGGEVAAPVFSAVMAGAARLLALTPDDLEDAPLQTQPERDRPAVADRVARAALDLVETL